MTDASGTNWGKFRAIRLLGRGGMGEVYLAEDRVLNRKVALKFLSREFQNEPGRRERLIREARAAAALDHPFICKIYEIGRAADEDFIAMEYVEGETLQHRLLQGPLPLTLALEAAAQIAGALEVADRHGIVHRDLKPSNLMFSQDGHIKVMDFGLAKQVVSSEESASNDVTFLDLSGGRSAMGTLAYMSPEQLQSRAIDSRSDIFSFGIVLYEMLTAAHPFRKDNPMATAVAIIQEATPPLTDYLSDCPELLQHTLNKMLAKDGAQRYQSVHEVKTNLLSILHPSSHPASESLRLPATQRPVKRAYWTTAGVALLALMVLLTTQWFRRQADAEQPGVGPTTTISALAVLPVRSPANNPQEDYFVDGMTDALIANLANVSALRVISRTSVMGYKNTTKPAWEIADELKVDALVEASIATVDDRLSMSAHLVDGQTGGIFWSRDFRQDPSEVMTLQRTVARAIAEAIDVELTTQAQAQLAPTARVNPRLYQEYLKGRYRLNRRTPQDFSLAVEHFRKAVREDPSFARAHAGLGEYYVFMGYYSLLPPKEAFPQARTALAKAIDLSPNLGEAHGLMSLVLFLYDWDWVAAENSFERALKLQPDSSIHLNYSILLNSLGKHEAAWRQIEKARQMDPIGADKHNAVGMHFRLSRSYDQSIDFYRNLRELDPDYHMSNVFLGLAYQEKGLYQEAIEEFEAAVAQIGRPAVLIGALGHSYGLAGEVEQARRILEELKQRAESSFVSGTEIATVLIGLGEKQEALKWLRRGVEQRAADLVYLNTEPEYDALKSEPEFQQILRELGFSLDAGGD